MKLWDLFWEWCEKIILYLYAKPMPSKPVEPVSTITESSPESISMPIDASMEVFRTAKSYLGQRLTMNENISPEVGCADAVSFVLKNCGFDIPQGGIPTVSGLVQWMQLNNFQESSASPGHIIVGRGKEGSHIGVQGETWIMSNTSYDALGLKKGLWQANYRPTNWISTFPNTRYFKPVISTPIPKPIA